MWPFKNKIEQKVQIVEDKQPAQVVDKEVFCINCKHCMTGFCGYECDKHEITKSCVTGRKTFGRCISFNIDFHCKDHDPKGD